jgi:hypothetical protein
VSESGTGDKQLDRALRQVQQELRKRGRTKGKTAGESSGDGGYSEIFDLSDTFRLLDRDGDGTISETEFYEGLELLGLGGGRFTERQQRKLWRLLDANGDGSVQYHELNDFVLRGKFDDTISKRKWTDSTGELRTVACVWCTLFIDASSSSCRRRRIFHRPVSAPAGVAGIAAPAAVERAIATRAQEQQTKCTNTQGRTEGSRVHAIPHGEADIGRSKARGQDAATEV